MSFGIQIINTAGNVTLDTTKKLPRVMMTAQGLLDFAGPLIISVPGINSDDSWVYLLKVRGKPTVGNPKLPQATIYQAGNTMWLKGFDINGNDILQIESITGFAQLEYHLTVFRN
jgi:hypothetical protein